MKLTDAQKRMLISARDNGDLYAHLQGRSEYGGAVWTVRALKQRGYIDQDWHITRAGLEALEAH